MNIHVERQQATCRMLQVACCFDMFPVAVRHVASTCCWCGRGLRWTAYVASEPPKRGKKRKVSKV